MDVPRPRRDTRLEQRRNTRPMAHTIHDIAVAKQIGFYSDAIEAKPNLRWLMTSGTPGFTDASKVPTDITGQSELAWENVLRVLSKADMTVDDIVKVTQGTPAALTSSQLSDLRN